MSGRRRKDSCAFSILCSFFYYSGIVSVLCMTESVSITLSCFNIADIVAIFSQYLVDDLVKYCNCTNDCYSFCGDGPKPSHYCSTIADLMYLC